MAALDQLIEGMFKFPEISRERWDLAEALLSVVEPFGEVEVTTSVRSIKLKLTLKGLWRMDFDMRKGRYSWEQLHHWSLLLDDAPTNIYKVQRWGDFHQVSDILPHLSWMLGEEASDPSLHFQRYK